MVCQLYQPTVRVGTREILAPKTNLDKQNKIRSKEEFGILVPMLNNEQCEEELAYSIIEILKDDKIREYYSKKSQERIKDFSKEKMMKEWTNLLEDN